MSNLSKGLCLLVVATSLQLVTSNLPEFDASNVTEIQLTFVECQEEMGRTVLLVLKDHLVQPVPLVLREERGQWGQGEM